VERIRRGFATVLVLTAMLVPVGSAHAVFPGQNGKIAYNNGGDIWTVDPDATDAMQLTSGPARDTAPNWSPDGAQIAFASTRDDPNPATCWPCAWEIYVMDADGTDVRRVTQDGTTSQANSDPAWAPDGTRIAYQRSSNIWSVRSDGTDVRRVSPDDPPGCYYAYHNAPTCSPDGTPIVSGGESTFCGEAHVFGMISYLDPAGGEPDNRLAWDVEPPEDWSPDAQQVLFGTDGVSSGMFRASRNGRAIVELTPCCMAYEGYAGNAAWSPDGTTIIFRRDSYDGSTPSGIFLIDATDGGNERPFPEPHNVACCFDWQSIPIDTYPRPKAATPMQVSLVPAYEPCTSPNRTHGPPLAFGSCNPPQQSSGALTVGTPDANGQAPKSKAEVWLRVQPGNPATPEDEADLRLSGSISDVRLASGLSDFTGTLEAAVSLRITDKDNTPHPGGAGAGTVQDFTYSFPIPCAGTADATIGGDCMFDTTAEALVPGTVREGTRAIWELGTVRVHDGNGAVFMTQGVFVP